MPLLEIITGQILIKNSSSKFGYFSGGSKNVARICFFFSKYLELSEEEPLNEHKYSSLSSKVWHIVFLLHSILYVYWVFKFKHFVVPTFVTKLTEYLCLGCFFFFRQISTLNEPLLTEFFISFKKYCFKKYNLKLYFTCDNFS